MEEMMIGGGGGGSRSSNRVEKEEDVELRRGPWTVDEDLRLINYIGTHGEGRWNSLARSAGLKRTGKSCRLRWLNYLRPDVRRGNITLQEQLLILDLHSRWGNRWSKIAQYLPGRTDNEIKNYWRTRVQKHAKQLKCDVNSKQFKDTMRYLWMPRLLERIQSSSNNININNNIYDHSFHFRDPTTSHLTQTSSNSTTSTPGPSSHSSASTSHLSPPFHPHNYYNPNPNPHYSSQTPHVTPPHQDASDNFMNLENIFFLQHHLI